ncbi:MAG: LptF/LptG family permease [Fidelibacterota bacterium]|nr:MAG: LptF/LptG family permease [Candidatus Neomarinimicrobiota bacterium]
MKIFHRYILKEHFSPFTLALVVLLFVLLTNFLLRAIDRFLGKGLGIGIVVEYIALNLAWIIALAVPMAVLVATLMSFGRLSHDNEITAMRTSGVSYATILRPALVFGTLVCLVLLYFNNQVLPDANHRARLLSADINRKRPDLAVEVGYFVDDLPSYGMLARERTGTVFKDILIYSKDNHTSQMTIFADRGTMQTIDDAILLFLEDGEIHELALPDYEEYRRLQFERHRIVIPVDNLYLERRESELRGDREMDIPMMLAKIQGYRDKIGNVRERIVRRISSQTSFTLPADATSEDAVAIVGRWQAVIADSSGLSRQDSTRLMRRANNLRRGLTGDINLQNSYLKGINRYQVEIHKKFSIPFACIVFVLVGAPVGIMARRGGFAVAMALSLGFFVIYWALLIAGEELADRGLLSPFLGMWAPNILLACLGIFLLWQIQMENRVWKLDILDLFRKKAAGNNTP